MPPPKLSEKIKSVRRVKLAGSSHTWSINLNYSSGSPQGTIASITPHDSGDNIQAPLALPALTHPHIHLDKAFVHNASKYSHLLPCTGTFQEAFSSTTKAKENFTYPDLLKRGEWLLAESVSSGVTAMRAFVEVDHTVKLVCLDAAVTLKSQWSEACHIQIACFAQDPIFSSQFGDENRTLIKKALEAYPQIDVLGTTPYVESSVEASKKNIEWAIDHALLLDKHVDFHLDYNLDPGNEPLIWHVLQTLQQRGWTSRSTRKRVMLGHCTRLTLLTDEEWCKISRIIHENDLPVSIVGLPTSDLYMAAPLGQESHQRARGTLRVPELIRKYDLDAVIAVNNVGNAFTPWGSADPLFLACVGVGVYQAGTQDDAGLLYECVSTRARAAIGLSGNAGLAVQVGISPDLVLFHDRDDTGCGISRPRTSVAEVVWDPPARTSRSVITNGRVQVGAGLSDDLNYEFA
ncbi:hypothetical protein N7490_010313 [Penicillium lividum]|nr:hypothetical protein N7490_010313 [Penicillium lividum]